MGGLSNQLKRLQAARAALQAKRLLKKAQQEESSSLVCDIKVKRALGEREPEFYATSKTFNKFDGTEYKFGVNQTKRPYSRLIVTAKSDPGYVYHYQKAGKKWICHGCSTVDKKFDEFGEFVIRDLYLPKRHICEPLSVEQSENEQHNRLSKSPTELYLQKLFNEQKDTLQILYPYNFEYGATAKSHINERKKIIVCEPTNRGLVREFIYKSPSVWYCTRCSTKGKKDTLIFEKDGRMYISNKHKCKAMKYYDAMYKQQAILNPGIKRRDMLHRLAAQKGDKMPLPDDPLLAAAAAAIQQRASSSSAAVAKPAAARSSSSSKASSSSRKRAASDVAPATSQSPSKPSSSKTSERAAKAPRLSKRLADKKEMRVFTPKNYRSPFPVKLLPPFNAAARPPQSCQQGIPLIHIKPVQPTYYRPVPVISFSPFNFGSSREPPPANNALSSSFNNSTVDNKSVKSEDNIADIQSSTTDQISTTTLSMDISDASAALQADDTQMNNEMIESMETADAGDAEEEDEIQILEPKEEQDYRATSASLLQQIDALMESIPSTTASSSTPYPTSLTNTVTSPAASTSPTLPFENDKVVDNQNGIPVDKEKEIAELEKPIRHPTPKPFESSKIKCEPVKQEPGEKLSYHFDPPSHSFIRATLEKLNIPFIRSALHFWAEVLYSEISFNSTPNKTSDISSANDSFFKCLSYFFTGTENYYYYIKTRIQSYFSDNFKTFEPVDGIDFSSLDITSPQFQELHQCNQLSSIHFNFICAWLQCRIGIFGENGILEKYGNWENEENPILLIKNDQGFYKPVLTLC